MKAKLFSSIVLVLAAGSIGCGQAMKPLAAKGVGTETTKGGVTSEDQMAKAEKASAAAKATILEAFALISQLTDAKGNIKVDFFAKATSVGTKALLDPFSDKLRSVFDQVFKKVALVKQQFAIARASLTDALVKVDQSTPGGAALAASIMDALSKLDEMEAEFSMSMHDLAMKLDLATAGLDLIVKGVTASIPGWGTLVGLVLDYAVMGKFKNLIFELKIKLLML